MHALVMLMLLVQGPVLRSPELKHKQKAGELRGKPGELAYWEGHLSTDR